MLENKGQISDGYHTFDELYNHRDLLFINLCQLRPKVSWIKATEDYPGYFCLYTRTPHGQISYHVQNKYRHMVEGLQVKDNEWDGHSSNDVIERMTKWGGAAW